LEGTLPITWIITILYCVAILTPFGQYALVPLAMIIAMALNDLQSVTLGVSRAVAQGDLPAWVGHSFFFGAFFVPIGLVSTAWVILMAEPEQRVSRGAQTFVMWLVMLAASVASATRMTGHGPVA
jgi:hypothetical protein